MSIFETGILCLLIVAIYLLQAILKMLTETKTTQNEQLYYLSGIMNASYIRQTEEKLDQLEEDYRKGKLTERQYRKKKMVIDPLEAVKEGKE